MKAVLLFACGLGVALCSGPFAAAGGLGRADLGPMARKMLEDLKTDNEHGRIFVRAWIGRTPEQVRDLVDYRKTHGLPSHWGYEKEFLELSTKD